MITFLLNACGLATKYPSVERLSQNGYSEIANWLDRDMPKRIKRHNITGIGIVVIDNGTIVVQKGYGFADKNAGHPVTDETLFRAGSVTKSFTAVGVLQLVEQGILDLDAPLRQAIPEFRIKSRNVEGDSNGDSDSTGSGDGVTLRRILSHHSGLPGDIVNGMWGDNPASVSSVVRLLQNQYLTSTPGTVFSYSNIGFSLAGRAIELATGDSYKNYMQQQVLQPLGMAASSFTLDVGNPDLSLGYADGNPITEYHIRDKPAGALITTTGDLAKFVKTVHAYGALDSSENGPRLLQQQTVTEMLTPKQMESPYSIDNLAALGWFKVPGQLPQGHSMLMHNGQTMAHSALVQLSMESGIGVVILSNSPAQEAMQAIGADIFDLAYKAKYPGQTVSINTPPRTLPGKPATAAGHYASEFGLIQVHGNDSRLNAEFADQRWSLKGNHTDGYSVKLKLLGLLPVTNDSLRALKVHFREVGKQKLVYVEQSGLFQLVASALQPQPPSSVWTSHVGSFELTTLIPSGGPKLEFGHMVLRRDNELYVLEVAQGDSNTEYALKIISDHEAVLQGYGRNLGSTVSVVEDGQLEWLGLRYRPVITKP